MPNLSRPANPTWEKLLALTTTTSCFSFSTYIKQMSIPSCFDFGLAFKTLVTIPDTTSPQHLNEKDRKTCNNQLYSIYCWLKNKSYVKGLLKLRNWGIWNRKGEGVWGKASTLHTKFDIFVHTLLKQVLKWKLEVSDCQEGIKVG